MFGIRPAGGRHRARPRLKPLFSAGRGQTFKGTAKVAAPLRRKPSGPGARLQLRGRGGSPFSQSIRNIPSGVWWKF